MAPKATPRTCKYCDAPAKPNIVNGRNKGWCRTCGSEKCTTEQYRDSEVNASKKFQQQRHCEFCKQEYTATSFTQRWCRTCVPNRSWSARAQRYGVVKPEWNRLLEQQHGHCALCDEQPTVVDHDHETGEVRGLLCNSCNLKLVGLDDTNWRVKAEKYRALRQRQAA